MMGSIIVFNIFSACAPSHMGYARFIRRVNHRNITFVLKEQNLFSRLDKTLSGPLKNFTEKGK